MQVPDVVNRQPESQRIPMQKHDYLENDPPLRNQKYFCASFLSPEDVMADCQVFVFSRFLEDLRREVSGMLELVSEALKKPELIEQGLRLVDGIRERHAYLFNDKDMQDQYKLFYQKNHYRLAEEHSRQNNYRTNVRGIKVSGCFATFEEARRYAEKLRSMFPNSPDICVGEVGCWAPWAPSPDYLEDVDYANSELNTLMAKYKDKSDAEQKEALHRIHQARQLCAKPDAQERSSSSVPEEVEAHMKSTLT